MENARSFRKFKKEPLILSLVLLAVFLAAFLFLYGKIQNNKKIADEVQVNTEAEHDRREETKSLERLVAGVEKEREEIESHFASSSNIVPFLDNLESLALSASVSLDINSVDLAKDKSALVADMKTTGTFEAVYKYLLLLENSTYQLDFLTIDLQKTNSESAEWTGNFRLKLLSFIP